MTRDIQFIVSNKKYHLVSEIHFKILQVQFGDQYSQYIGTNQLFEDFLKYRFILFTGMNTYVVGISSAFAKTLEFPKNGLFITPHWDIDIFFICLGK